MSPQSMVALKFAEGRRPDPQELAEVRRLAGPTR
jgi:hypothetical protein